MTEQATHEADLEDWQPPVPIIGQRMIGTIRNDSKMRFSDGRRVLTSPVVSIDGDIVETRNTTYRLVK